MKRLFGILALLFACATASAGPGYHVVVDTQAYAGQSGYLDFLILGQAAASPLHATLSGFSGIVDDGGGAAIFLGDVGGSIATGVVLGNAEGWNEFGQWTRFGGHLVFDVSFDIDPQPGAGSTLELALLDRDLNYLQAAGDAIAFATLPGQDPVVTHTDAVRLPEAPAPALCLTGLALLGLARRRRA
ncbi:NF038129 family PEP-CTERM protein [Telluria mixta]|uniref:NF038129 family PEP-CTERM protein n=1 Tax=Telluria mixta TaxID=34071 RepID=A0ABT2C0G3_9BURK|nr:NF038129 family PEP-CTERM protein [Telluria mixta]MCS0630154.1 NF038129 family PEP-CTERM protein [Telluria mixta]WEM94532.1 NF038129 family PEP-CTERM protein [Telluria mixta]